MNDYIIALVAPIGSSLAQFQANMVDCLKDYTANVYEINVTDVLKPFISKNIKRRHKRLNKKIQLGNELRKASSNDIFAQYAIAEISRLRRENKDDQKRVFIIRQLKRPEEYKKLREIYQSNFFLVGVNSDHDKRIINLISDCHHSELEEAKQHAKELFNRDENEQTDKEAGQKLVKVFQKSDVFFNDDSSKKEIQRFLDLIYSSPFVSPTRSEILMNLAFSSSLKSIDLSRQVGAVLSDNNGEVISVGCNDVPRAGGGQYYEEDESLRDWEWGIDPNKEEIQTKIKELVDGLTGEGYTSDEQKENLQSYLEETSLDSITEYARAVHAELETILSAARQGKSTLGKTLYCTTFPCHNCAKHIVGAGIKQVFYIEPYAKSLALKLHSDSISKTITDDNKVRFTQFIGIGPSRFNDLFSLIFTTGEKISRKDSKSGQTVDYLRHSAEPKFKYEDYVYKHVISEEDKIGAEYNKQFEKVYKEKLENAA